MKYIVRFIFVSSVVVLGYSIELLWQSHRSEGETRSSAGHERYVLIGGSISRGLAEFVERNLREIENRQDIDVIDMADPLLTIDDATTRAKRALETHRPKAILLMIGMHEFSFERDWTQRARELLKSGDDDALVETVLGRVREGDLRAPLTLFFLNREGIQKCKCRPRLVAGIDERLDALVTTAPRNPDTDRVVFQLIRLAMTARSEFVTDTEKLGAMSTRWTALASTFRLMETWAREARSMDYVSFVNAGGEAERISRSWFWYAWRRSDHGGSVSPLEHFTKHAEDLNMLIPIPRENVTRSDLDTYFPEPSRRRIVEAMTSSTRVWIPIPLETKLDDAEILEKFSLPDLENLSTREKGRLFLVHYPGTRLSLVDAMSKKFGIPALAPESRLTKILGSPEERLYFLDRVGTSGHLTQAGLEIFGRVVAEELAREMK